MSSIRFRHRALRSATVCAAVTATAIAGTALPSSAAVIEVPIGTYSATLPFDDQFKATGSSSVYDLKITNTSSLAGYLLRSATATATGLTVTAAPAGVTDSAGATWSITRSGNTLSVAPSGNNTGLATGSSLTLPVTATAPTTSGSYAWVTSANGTLGETGLVTDFGQDGGEPTVNVAPFAGTDTCAINEVCDTGQVGSEAHTKVRGVTSAPGSMQDTIAATVGGPEGPCGALVRATDKSKAVTVDTLDTARTVTVTLELDKSVVQTSSNNGADKYDVCHEAPKTFTTKSGAPATPTLNGTFVGFLPLCADMPSASRCIISRSGTGSGDRVVTFRQPGGDPKSVMGIVDGVSGE